MPRKNVYALWAVVTCAWWLLDQLTKLWAVAALEGREPIDLKVLDLQLIRNPGAAFGIQVPVPALFLVITVVVITLVVRALPRTERRLHVLAYGLVTGGALGNVTDRLVRFPGFPSGHVVDFIDLRWWPVFNFADIGICVGAALVVLALGRIERDQRSALHATASE